MEIPVFIVEEHHEVFPIWHEAVRLGQMPRSGSLLLHVDEHSDMSLPRLRKPLPRIGSELSELKEFAYTELDIGNFIWPAVYQGIFAKVCWIRASHKSTTWQSMKICAKSPDGCEFITGSSLIHTAYEKAADQRTMEYELLTTANDFPGSESWALDIDLDYLCCNSFPDLGQRVLEISKAEYNEISSNVYHFLRISPGMKVSWEQSGGRYLLRFNYSARSVAPEYNPDQIQTRLEALLLWASGAPTRPSLVTVCRSVHSGYTPRAEADRIQQLVVDRLEEIWPLRHGFVEVPAERAVAGVSRW